MNKFQPVNNFICMHETAVLPNLKKFPFLTLLTLEQPIPVVDAHRFRAKSRK